MGTVAVAGLEGAGPLQVHRHHELGAVPDADAGVVQRGEGVSHGLVRTREMPGRLLR